MSNSTMIGEKESKCDYLNKVAAEFGVIVDKVLVSSTCLKEVIKPPPVEKPDPKPDNGNENNSNPGNGGVIDLPFAEGGGGGDQGAGGDPGASPDDELPPMD